VYKRQVKKVGKELKNIYEHFDRKTIKLKSHHEILTRADLLSEAIIIRNIRKNFPVHSILSEEKGMSKESSDYLWILDPVDGTTNFSMHNPLWAVSLALAYKQKIVLGIVHAPILNETFVAEKGKGAKLNGKKITVSQVKDGKVLNTFCHGSTDEDIKKAVRYYSKQKISKLDCRQLGSASIELAYVASSRIESIVIPGAHAWDVAAGVLLVREAGGQVTDFKGKQWDLKSKDIAASNGLVHNDILKVLK
jgi:myo-inositol-1(or 4)-monophosphatase